MSDALRRALDEEEITGLLDAYTAAIRAKDALAVVALYTEDVVGYDLAPPLRTEPGTMRNPDHLRRWFDTWEGPIVPEPSRLDVVVGDDVAFAFGLRHMTGTKRDGERVDLWFRATACFRREHGAWKIAHAHDSVPFAMDGSGRALLDLQP